MLKLNSETRIWAILETKGEAHIQISDEPIELVHGKVKFLIGTKEIPFPIPILVKSKNVQIYLTLSRESMSESTIWDFPIC